MKINGNEIRPGNVIEHKGKLWVAVKTNHVKPGKGPAYAQVELKAIMEGTKLNERFRASETVERARIDEEDYQFLFAEGDQLTFMHQETFEQLSLPQDLVGDQMPFLQDGMTVKLATHEGSPVFVNLPKHATCEIVETQAVVKGQTAASSFKPAILDNGVRIMVPPHIVAGTKVVVNIEEQTYVERAK